MPGPVQRLPHKATNVLVHVLVVAIIAIAVVAVVKDLGDELDPPGNKQATALSTRALQ
jgi:hypothetical protein